MSAKASLSARALETAIQSATNLEELKALVAKNSTERAMNADGTIRGLVFCNQSTRRGAVLSVAIRRGKPGGFTRRRSLTARISGLCTVRWST